MVIIKSRVNSEIAGIRLKTHGMENAQDGADLMGSEIECAVSGTWKVTLFTSPIYSTFPPRALSQAN